MSFSAIRTAWSKAQTSFGFWLTYVYIILNVIPGQSGCPASLGQLRLRPRRGTTTFRLLASKRPILLTSTPLDSFPSAAVAKQFLRTSTIHPSGGFSWVLVDAEHGMISDHHYYEVGDADFPHSPLT